MDVGTLTFKAYDKEGRHVLTTWVWKGSMADQMERDAFQVRLNRGELSYVDVIDPSPGPKTTTMLRHR